MILLSFTDIVPAFFESIGESAAETFSYLGTLLPAFLSATVQTLELFALTLIFALPLGLIISCLLYTS